MRFFQICLLVVCLSACQPEEYTLHLVGDSTMADKDNPETNPEFGWGQVLPKCFDDQVTVVNHAKNGRSTKSFINEGRWQKVVEELDAGDYVFIQFGHNDQKVQHPKRYTNPYSGYRFNLEKMIRETKSKGAIPVMFSSIVRRNFNEHGVLEDTHGAYPFVARSVASEMNVPFVDMQVVTENLVNQLGEEPSKELYLWIEPGTNEYYPDGKHDNTHFSKKGAIKMCQLVIEEIKKYRFNFLENLKN
ncbi:Lysophospholipase L1 [Reichenbachiella faecimaris]|uniref:Lysophospholipase L1 n=1 Tax=Reichenbachiella faecimaris TaxID=692418 RepID=A0A1W2G7G9_REIFA|nr:rhamnogalacturonan acetylesterase [Reichenbachiella faecimaris]SMD32288.1 Lysophospholipase L1 [Reichenbachiella faecimaris]